MSQVKSNRTEQELADFKREIDEKSWGDIEFVVSKAKEVEKRNLPLAYLIMQRALELRPSGPKIKRHLADYENRLAKTKLPVDVVIDNSVATKSSSEDSVSTITTPQTNQPITLALKEVIKRPIVLFVVLPWLFFAVYMVWIASPRYESQTQVLVQQPDGMATMDASMALLSGLGVSGGNTDPQLVKAYIYSSDMLQYLENKLSIIAHYSDTSVDWLSRLSSKASREQGLKFYQKQVQVDVDEVSQIVIVYVRAFSPDFALILSEEIAQRAEWYINSIGHQLANAQLEFIEGEHQRVELRLQEAKKRLLSFQQQYNLLDPEAEGAALSQITYAIESQIATAHAELRALRSTMSSQAPQVVMAQAKLDALYEQLNLERDRLTEQRGGEPSHDNPEGLSVSQLLARFTDYKVNLELALAAYTSSQVSLEKSRIEAYRQLKYLIKVESPTLPEDNKYPQVTYNLALFAAVLLMLFGIGKIVVATVKELN
ncbi:lipopolysaccharide biosynthesis protein [Agarivorans aestuarii]|uniref:Lipopolysaccharide biosynthesis protein n=1 Tax=Agarivorans aestuarii TaxID=1563703 RepID=A0ABU7G0V7_9ALTE|nr:lipopolysaccharide biosynthesis protein [Agarivorans aestuarii]MEE1672804.1 lipopolysaccharide biosynthesis protein [Agarivorans aestuarii]